MKNLKYLSLTAILIAFSFCAGSLKINTASAEGSLEDHIEMLADTSKSFGRDGLYRVHDHESNNIIYILTTYRNQSNPQMVVVEGK